MKYSKLHFLFACLYAVLAVGLLVNEYWLLGAVVVLMAINTFLYSKNSKKHEDVLEDSTRPIVVSETPQRLYTDANISAPKVSEPGLTQDPRVEPVNLKE